MTGTDAQSRMDVFRARLEADPGSKVFVPLADLLRCDGRFDTALELLEAGLSRHPDFLSARVVRGRVLMDAGRRDEGRRELTGVLERDRENLVVRRLLVEDAIGRGDPSDAREHLEILAVLDPDEARWKQVLADLRLAANAEHQQERAPAGDGPPSFQTMTLVDIYLAQGYRDKARAALERMLEDDPDRSDAAERLADIEEGYGFADETEAARDTAPSGGGFTGRDKSERRKQDKQKFDEWISRIKDQGDVAP